MIDLDRIEKMADYIGHLTHHDVPIRSVNTTTLSMPTTAPWGS